MREALKPNQKWYWQIETYEFKISFDYFRPVLFDVCVPIINMVYFALPSTSMWGRAMDVLLPRHPRPRQMKKRRSQRFQQINAF